MWTWEQKGLILAAVFMLHISCYGGLSEMSSKPSLHKSNSDFSCYQYHNLVSIKVNKKLRFTNYRCIFFGKPIYIICHTGTKKYLLQVYQRIPRGSGYPIPRRRCRFSQYRPHCRTLVKTVQYEIWMFLASHDLKLYSYIGFIQWISWISLCWISDAQKTFALLEFAEELSQFSSSATCQDLPLEGLKSPGTYLTFPQKGWNCFLLLSNI